MKKISLFLLVAMMSMSVLADYPRKFLIDHFTGEECGYCPYGMYCIEDFMASYPGQYIWLSHHYGFGADEYTIPANSVIGVQLGVTGAPSMAINRTSRKVNGSTVMEFHPGYIPEGLVSVTDVTTSEASVSIVPTFDAATRSLSVTVSGQSTKTNGTQYLLSVFVKESGMTGAQKDYYFVMTGGSSWAQFTHTNTARCVLTAALGDTVAVADGAYSFCCSGTLAASWVENNCRVVAVLTNPTTGAVINCEEIPVVAGTDGGASIAAGPVVDATYPEIGTPITKYAFTTKTESDYTASSNVLLVVLKTSNWFKYNSTKCVQNLRLWFVQNNSTLAPGVYPINDTFANGTVYAGYVSRGQVDGSCFLYVAQSDSTAVQGGYVLVSGQVTVYDNGSIRVEATTINGSTIDVHYGTLPTAIENVEEDYLLEPVKQLRNGRVEIHRGNKAYSLSGQMLY